MSLNKAKNKALTKSAAYSARDYFPNDPVSQRILQERAERIAKSVLQPHQSQETATYIRFYLGATEKYGVPYEYAKEVIDQVTLTLLPCAPAFIAGVMNRRGALLAVLDLRQFLYKQSSTYSNKASVIIIGANEMIVGVLADRIEGGIHYDPKKIDPPLFADNTLKAKYLIGLHQGETAIINIEAILSDPQLQLDDTIRFYKRETL